jgi:glycosyltransferase involved in cell wall biosynthesis
VVTLTAGARDDLIRNFAVLPERIAAMETNAVITPGVAAELAAWDGEGGREADLVVSVGRLSPEKNQRLLLRAMALGHGQRRWRLAFVGDGPERQALAKLAAELGLSDRVQFAGYVADPFAWTKRPAVLASSSTYEGLGNAIIEALACGTPVVSTDCPYGPAEILEHGRYGTLVPLDDAERMAEAIAAALERPVDRKHLMARGLNYTQERAAERFQAIIAGL